MATTTPRIGLTKPDLTDLVDIGVLNTNFDKIDSNIASTKIQATKPTTANAGDLWWDSDTGTLYVYYTDANSSQWVAATSDPINIGVVANQTERDAQYPTPAQGMSVWRQDLGAQETYYGLYNASTNPGGRDSAGWYTTSRAGGLVPIKPTTITAVSGSATINAIGTISFSGCTAINLDGIFTAKYKNYKVNFQPYLSAGETWLELKLRAVAANLVTTNYAYTVRRFENSSVLSTDNSAQYSSLFSVIGPNAGAQSIGFDITSPQLSAYTSWFGQSETRHSTGLFNMSIFGGMYTQTTSADGFSIIPQSGNISGTIQVFGYND